jgi:hypothetical protein
MASVMVSRLMIFLLLTTVLIVTRWPLMQTWISQHPVITGIFAMGVSMPFLIVFRRPRAVLLSSLQSERIAIAEVHAAILSIFITALSAYALVSYSRFDQIQQDAFEKADEINTFGYKPRYYGDPTIGIYVASDEKNRQELVDRFNILASGFSRFSSWEPPRDTFNIYYEA